MTSLGASSPRRCAAARRAVDDGARRRTTATRRSAGGAGAVLLRCPRRSRRGSGACAGGTRTAVALPGAPTSAIGAALRRIGDPVAGVGRALAAARNKLAVARSRRGYIEPRRRGHAFPAPTAGGGTPTSTCGALARRPSTSVHEHRARSSRAAVRPDQRARYDSSARAPLEPRGDAAAAGCRPSSATRPRASLGSVHDARPLPQQLVESTAPARRGGPAEMPGFGSASVLARPASRPAPRRRHASAVGARASSGASRREAGSSTATDPATRRSATESDGRRRARPQSVDHDGCGAADRAAALAGAQGAESRDRLPGRAATPLDRASC